LKEIGGKISQLFSRKKNIFENNKVGKISRFDVNNLKCEEILKSRISERRK